MKLQCWTCDSCRVAVEGSIGQVHKVCTKRANLLHIYSPVLSHTQLTGGPVALSLKLTFFSLQKSSRLRFRVTSALSSAPGESYPPVTPASDVLTILALPIKR